MKKYFSLLKKQILCLVATLLATVTITVIAQNNCINLKLNKKPTYTSTYEWCKKRAKANVNMKATVLLIFLKIKSKKDWKNLKNNIAKPYGPWSYTKVAMPENMQNCVYNVFNNHEVVKAVKPISIHKERKNDGKVQKIVVQTENFGTIKIATVSGNLKGKVTTDKDGYTIILSPSTIKKLKLSNDSIKGIIGHELAHIIYDDAFEWYIFDTVYCKKHWYLNPLEYSDYYFALSRACETRADIVGTFGNPRWAKGLIEFFKKINTEDSSDHISKHSTHPTPKQRIAYLEKIYKFLSNK